MRRWVVIGRRASASPEFSLIDIAGTSGRLDVLLRCLRAALLVSHGLRRDTVVYLVLLGGDSAPRAMRVDGAAVRFVRPDERALATMVKKALATPREGSGFVDVRPGIAIADGGLEVVLADLAPGAAYVLEEGATDVREARLDPASAIVFVGDHLGLDDEARAAIAAFGAAPIGVGPVSLHADDAITIACNELDRREHRAR
jgi:tRNA (pseudouridine54-N1)-methyltransferase